MPTLLWKKGVGPNQNQTLTVCYDTVVYNPSSPLPLGLRLKCGEEMG